MQQPHKSSLLAHTCLFWLGRVQCSNWHQHPVPDETGTIFGNRFLESIYGAGFWHCCMDLYDQSKRYWTSDRIV